MKKRLISMALAICLLCTMLPVAAMATEGGCAEGCTYESVTVDATCTEPGSVCYTCAVCGHTYEEVTDALGHEYAEGVCVRCGDVEFKPEAPVVTIQNVSATGEIQLNWNAVDGAVKYHVYCGTDEAGEYTLLETVVGTTLTHAAEIGSRYYYYVTAQGETGSPSDPSETVTAVCKLARPVVTLSNDAPTGKIKISWEPVEGAVQYKVYRSSSGNTGTWSRISTTTKTSVINTKNIQPGDKFYYTVIAIAENTAANSDSAVGKARMCDLPQPVVTAEYVASSNGVKVSWAPIEGAVQYKVYRSLTGNAGTWSRISTTVKTAVTNTKNFDRNQTYYYKVIALAENSSANSAYSEAAVYTPTVEKLDAPVLTATNIASSGKIKLSWTKVEGAVKYEVYRATSQNGAYSLLIATKNTSINNTSTTAGKTYYYKVKAISEDPAANSDYSAVKIRTCDLPRPTTTAGVNTKGQPKLTWKAVDGAVSYKVYRATTENGSYKLMKTTTNTTYVNTSITTYETYFYKVVAVAENTAANSAQSVAKAITSTSVNITPSQLNKDFLSRINEYREYFEIDTLDWNKDAELTVRTRAAEYQIAYDSSRPDGRAVDKMLESVGIQFELGLQADTDAADVVDIIMYYEEYEDYAALFMYEDWEHAVIARNGDYWCIMFG